MSDLNVLWYMHRCMVCYGSLRTFCLAVLHGVQAIIDTLPAVRRLRGGASPPLPEPPPPPIAPPIPPLAAEVPPLLLDPSANLAEEEDDDSACWFEGANERNEDMLSAVIKKFQRSARCVGYLYGGECGFGKSVGAEKEKVYLD